MSFESELDAFRAYAKEFPSECTLLVDTYDTLKGIENAVRVGKEMESVRERLKAIRLDSGDFLTHAASARAAFEKADLSYVDILASGGLDEYEIDRLEREYAPIDGYGVGTKVSVSSDAPWSESVYKMVEINGVPVSKSSEGKRSLPHRKSVHRVNGTDGLFAYDTITASGTDSDSPNGRPMLRNRFLNGERVIEPVSIQSSRKYHMSEMDCLPDKYKNIHKDVPYPVKTLLPDQADPG
jgi:nicotinate phosphoribosyltransferase